MNTKKIDSATAAPIISVIRALPVLIVTGGCVAARHMQELPTPTPLAAPTLPKGLRDGQKLLEYCGAVAQYPTADYRINLCLDPSPYASFNFAEHPPSLLELAAWIPMEMATVLTFSGATNTESW